VLRCRDAATASFHCFPLNTDNGSLCDDSTLSSFFLSRFLEILIRESTRLGTSAGNKIETHSESSESFYYIAVLPSTHRQ